MASVRAYLSKFGVKQGAGSMDLTKWPDREGTGQVKIVAVRLLDESGAVTGRFERGRSMQLEFDIDSDFSGELTYIAIVSSDSGARVLNLAHYDSPEPIPRRVSGAHTVRFQVPRLPLAAGTYDLTLGVLTDQMRALAVVWNALPFTMADGTDSTRPYETTADWGYCWTPSHWRVDQR